jgi:hypothetical protein
MNCFGCECGYIRQHIGVKENFTDDIIRIDHVIPWKIMDEADGR